MEVNAYFLGGMIIRLLRFGSREEFGESKSKSKSKSECECEILAREARWPQTLVTSPG